MRLKDYLFISKNDRRAIIVLFIIVLILVISNIVAIRIEKSNKESEIIIPADYIQWQNKLKEKRLEERKAYLAGNIKNEYNYQPKLNKGETIELNTADTTQLKMIPGIGSTYAKNIVSLRESLGGYANINQLNEAWGIDTYLFSQIEPYFTLDEEYKYLHINTDSFKVLLKHPYLNYKQVIAITDIRERKGAINSMKRLELLEEFTPRDIRKLTPYINFSQQE